VSKAGQTGHLSAGEVVYLVNPGVEHTKTAQVQIDRTASSDTTL